jgi:hypothetical protein
MALAHPGEEPAGRHLTLLNHETGERREFDEASVAWLVAENERLQDVVKGLEADVRGWTVRHANLKRDKERDAQRNALWPVARRLFKFWQAECNHPRSAWGLDSFELVAPHLRKHGEALCMVAIAGVAFDHFSTVRKNGTKKRYDDWEFVFRDRKNFEECVNRCPKERRVEIMASFAPELDEPASGQPTLDEGTV